MNERRSGLRFSTALVGLIFLSAGCAPADNGASSGADDPAPGPDVGVFPATPADGPMPEIPPAPEGYTPTAAGSPSTDIWLAELTAGDGVAVGEPTRATNRAGYDNQPSFTLDGAGLLYVSAVDATQTEVMRLNVADGESERVTSTVSVSEFSPTQIPGQEAFSAIHEIRSKQYLWRYSMSGDLLGPIFATAEPVGYHAWADQARVAMFILGNPPTLQLGDAVSGEIRVIAERPGRSIHRIPDSQDISFVRKVSDEEWWIERLDPTSGETSRITQTLPGREDYAWTPDGAILMGDGSTLHAWTAANGWVQIADFADAGVEGITRLAVSPDGSRVAIVANGP